MRKKLSFSKDATIMYWLPPSGKATHNAIIWDGKEFKLYINGEFQDYKAIEYEFEDYNNNTNNLEDKV